MVQKRKLRFELFLM